MYLTRRAERTGETRTSGGAYVDVAGSLSAVVGQGDWWIGGVDRLLETVSQTEAAVEAKTVRMRKKMPNIATDQDGCRIGNDRSDNPLPGDEAKPVASHA